MSEKHLHIISFNIPYPANYGGVIDVFYKIKYLHEKGVKVHLHCFKYGRTEAPELEKICYKVYYYKRKTGILNALSFIPYIISSRRSWELMKNLLTDNHPILFEGLHSCYYLDDKRLKNRFKIFRESNIEHFYYQGLAAAEKNIFKKMYFFFAAWKLSNYEKVVNCSNLILTVSQTDTSYFKNKFKAVKTIYLPSFHPFDEIKLIDGKGNYLLYHGNLEVAENIIAVKYLVSKIFTDLDVPLKIAGLNPDKELKQLVNKYSNVELIPNPSDTELHNLISNAQANLVITFQATGLKLKLLNVLYNGRFCIANKDMLQGTSLEELCRIANNSVELKKEIQDIFSRNFNNEEILKRKELLKPYSNKEKTEKLIELVFN